MKNIVLRNAWLTLNRECNLRCKWCYAQGTGFGSDKRIEIKLAKNLIRLISDMGISNLTLTGGEPMLYVGIEEVIKFAASMGMSVSLVTNGRGLNDKDNIARLSQSGLKRVELSLKGSSSEDYIKNTGNDCWNKVIEAIRSLSEANIATSFTYVINSENYRKIPNLISTVKSYGGDFFYFSFVHDFSVLDGEGHKHDFGGDRLAKSFEAVYEQIHQATEGNFVLHASLPACFFSRELLNLMRERKQLSMGCQLLSRSGLIFDVDGSLLMCNAMYQVPIGKYGKDFKDKEELQHFLDSDSITRIYNNICRLPYEKCSACDIKYDCRGGCLANWM